MKKLLLFLLLSFPALAQEAFDVRKTRWGMAKAEVMSSELSKPSSDSTWFITYKDVELGRFRANIDYFFQNDQLATVRMRLMRQSLPKEKMLTEDFEALLDVLKAKYGKPKYSTTPTKFASNGFAGWETDRTFIKMGYKVETAEMAKFHYYLIYHPNKDIKPKAENPADF
ncbi:hypothetical protein [Tellurirhabdus bombi]|uniref:hypothetical protein n=1 Tax=Tellurirhabdus bombi TaxID=2907205 RepID=UPI001F3A1808|nr:hypothetical protein [Tellurirhabdus bombi]